MVLPPPRDWRSWLRLGVRLQLSPHTHTHRVMMSPLVARLLLLVACLALPLYGVEKVRNRGYRKDPDADKVRERGAGRTNRAAAVRSKKFIWLPYCLYGFP